MSPVSVFHRTAIAAAVVIAFGMAGCKKETPPGQVPDAAAANAPKESSSLGAAVDDTGTTVKVKSAINNDDRTRGTDINVETNNGIVTLSGTVKTADAKSVAEEITHGVPGVKGVDNKITAPSTADTAANSVSNAADKAGEAITDTAITTKVKTALLADERTKGTQITVTTTDGVVALGGNASSANEKSAAVDIAQKIDGVKKVDASTLKIGK